MSNTLLIAGILECLKKLHAKDYVRNIYMGDKGELVVCYSNGFTQKIKLSHLDDTQEPLDIDGISRSIISSYIKSRDFLSLLLPSIEAKVQDLREGIIQSVRDSVRDGKDGRDGLDGKDGKDGRDGLDGKDADSLLILSTLEERLTDLLNIKASDLKSRLESSVSSFIASIELPKDGIDGKDGRDGLDGKDAEYEQIFEYLDKRLDKSLIDLRESLEEYILSIPTPKDGKDGIDGIDGLNGKDGKDADPEQVTKEVLKSLKKYLDSSISVLTADLKKEIKRTIEKMKKSFKPEKGEQGDKGDKGDKGEQGEEGNGVLDAKIDRRDHLIIRTRDKEIDAGKVAKRYFGGGAGEFLYTNSKPMPFDVGGLKAGTTFQSTTLKVLWTRLLYGYDMPVFSTFTIDIPQEVEIGYKILDGQYDTNFSITNTELLKDSSISITKDGVVLAQDLPNISPYSLHIPYTSLDSAGKVAFQIKAQDTTDAYFSKDFLLEYKYRIYYGEYTEDITDTGLPNPLIVLRATELKSDIYGEYFFQNVGYKWFCYPERLGEHYIFFDIASDISLVFDEVRKITVVNEHGLSITYNCYRTFNEIHAEFIMGVKN